MGKISDIELLATLENLRLKKWNSTESPDYILRVATAIAAANIGYKSRIEWSEELQRLGLVEYKVSRVAAAETAAVKYEQVMSMIKMRAAKAAFIFFLTKLHNLTEPKNTMSERSLKNGIASVWLLAQSGRLLPRQL